MKKLLTLTAFALLAMTSSKASAGIFGLFGHGCCGKGCYSLKVKQYNAFTPFCSGCITSHGCGACCTPQPRCMIPQPYCPAPACGPDACADGHCAAPRAPMTAPATSVAKKGNPLPTGPQAHTVFYRRPATAQMPVQPMGYYPYAYPQYPQYPYGYGYGYYGYQPRMPYMPMNYWNMGR